MSRDIIQALQKALSDEDEGVRQAAASSLDALEARADIDVLLGQLKNGERGQKITAAYALGRINSPKVFLPLLDALKSKDSDLRVTVAQVLGNKCHPKTLGPLIRALSDPEPGVQAEVVKAVACFSDRRIPAYLEPLLKNTEEVALAVVEALGNLGFSEGQAALLTALKDNRPKIRQAAAKGIGRI